MVATFYIERAYTSILLLPGQITFILFTLILKKKSLL